MKVFALFVFLPMVLGTAPAKRFLFGDFDLAHLFSNADLAHYVNQIVDQVGSDATEQQCEQACIDVMNNDVLDSSCPFICSSFQSLVHQVHMEEQQQQPSQQAKRFLFGDFDLAHLFSNADLAHYVNQIVDQVGSDATEQQCEQACIDVMNNDVLDSSCPFICSSFQSLVHQVHMEEQQQQPSQQAKRFLFGDFDLAHLFSNADLAHYVNQIVDQVGSDATEQQCEQACIDVMNNDVLDSSCPFICSSFQSLVHQVHMEEQQQQQPSQQAKRFLFGDFDLAHLFSSADLAHYVNQIVDQVGSDATEQQCEQACIDVMNNDVLDSSCPFICSSFQSLVHQVHLEEQQQQPSQQAKRFLFGDFDLAHLFSNADLAHYVNQIVDQVGSDATEQQCEQACIDVMNNDVLDSSCPFICSSFQSLVHQVHLEEQQQPSQQAKRFLFGDFDLAHLFSNADLAHYVNQIVDQVGSDATEQQCEQACIDVMNNDVLDSSCPFICSSFQSLVHQVHLEEQQQQPSQQAKRFLFGDFDLAHLFSNADLAHYVNQIVDQVGSDATEQQCEQACIDVMNNAVLDSSCPFICSSFQSLVHQVHMEEQQQQQQPSQQAKRFLFGDFDLAHLFSNADLTHYVNQIVDQVGSDATEQQCEQACIDVMNNDLLDSSCPFICSSFQSLVHQVHMEEQQQQQQQQPSQQAKRFLFGDFDLAHLFSNADLAHYVNQIVDQVGSDATEQQCEQACIDVMNNAVLDSSCPFICSSFQSLVHQVHMEEQQQQQQQQPSQQAKRFLFGDFDLAHLFSNADLAHYVNQIVDQVGSDATEQQCEQACIDVMNNDVLDSSCPFICSSFQSLVHQVHMEEQQQQPSQQAKRFLFGDFDLAHLFSNADLAHYVNQIVDQVGSDATEQQCEQACIDVMNNAVLDSSCPFICSSFQSLVHQVHMEEQQQQQPQQQQ